MFLQRFIMLSPQLGPARELVLRAHGTHLTLQPYDFPTQSDLILHVLGRLEGEAGVDLP